MAKSIRSKKKRKLRSLKREKLDSTEEKKILERTEKLKVVLQEAAEKKEAADPTMAVDGEAKAGAADGEMDFKEDDYNEFGKPPKMRRSKINQEQKRKKVTKKKGVKHFLNFATRDKTRKKTAVRTKYFGGN